VTLVAALLLLGAFPLSHADGAGPLASSARPGSESMCVDPSVGATEWTFGTRLCVQPGMAAATLRSIAPTKTVGTGWRLLGSGVRTFSPSESHMPIISVDGYPPPAQQVPDPIVPVASYRVTTQCSDDPAAPYTELLLGLARTGNDGGGWQGIEIDYDVDGLSARASHSCEQAHATVIRS
jgi:hypothetical protein